MNFWFNTVLLLCFLRCCICLKFRTYQHLFKGGVNFIFAHVVDGHVRVFVHLGEVDLRVRTGECARGATHLSPSRLLVPAEAHFVQLKVKYKTKNSRSVITQLIRMRPRAFFLLRQNNTIKASVRQVVHFSKEENPQPNR